MTLFNVIICVRYDRYSTPKHV